MKSIPGRIVLWLIAVAAGFGWGLLSDNSVRSLLLTGVVFSCVAVALLSTTRGANTIAARLVAGTGLILSLCWFLAWYYQPEWALPSGEAERRNAARVVVPQCLEVENSDISKCYLALAYCSVKYGECERISEKLASLMKK